MNGDCERNNKSLDIGGLGRWCVWRLGRFTINWLCLRHNFVTSSILPFFLAGTISNAYPFARVNGRVSFSLHQLNSLFWWWTRREYGIHFNIHHTHGPNLNRAQSRFSQKLATRPILINLNLGPPNVSLNSEPRGSPLVLLRNEGEQILKGRYRCTSLKDKHHLNNNTMSRMFL